ncbi:transposase [Streptomyces sp. NBC_01538]|uniref:transposase n=1 Tax=Streptomyces sp. NBC_01538 TaxID=2903897 RepID=UPI0038669BD6
MARGDLTDTQWACLEPLLPRRKKPGRPPTWTRRQLIDGIRFRTRTGVPWRDVPERYGPWARVYDLFRRWQRDGTWQRIFASGNGAGRARSYWTTPRPTGRALQVPGPTPTASPTPAPSRRRRTQDDLRIHTAAGRAGSVGFNSSTIPVRWPEIFISRIAVLWT